MELRKPNRRSSQSKPGILYIKVCNHCGEKFETTDNRDEYCNPQHRQRARWKRVRDRRQAVKVAAREAARAALLEEYKHKRGPKPRLPKAWGKRPTSTPPPMIVPPELKERAAQHAMLRVAGARGKRPKPVILGVGKAPRHMMDETVFEKVGSPQAAPSLRAIEETGTCYRCGVWLPGSTGQPWDLCGRC